jgi:hypothetical protein
MPIGHVWATVFEQPAANILELDLTWSTSPFIEDALLVFKRWTDLRRLKLRITSRDDEDVAAPPFELVCDVIRNMRSLTCLSIADDGFDHDEIAILQSKVDDKVKVPRPNFVFKVKVE